MLEAILFDLDGTLLTTDKKISDANRAALEKACAERGCKLYLPPLKLCGDNAAMIGAQAYYEYLAGNVADMSLNAYATKSILGEKV